jgi:histidinol dehydrogenase
VYLAHMGAERAGYASTVLSGPMGGIVLARDADEAIAFINDYAPEHLQVLSAEPEAYVDRLHHAGEILLGFHTPSTLGNYVIGANHVLPTAGWAKTGSGLSVHDFLKRTSIVKATREGYRSLAPHAKAFADYEGFDAHGNGVSHLRDEILGISDNGKTD